METTKSDPADSYDVTIIFHSVEVGVFSRGGGGFADKRFRVVI